MGLVLNVASLRRAGVPLGPLADPLQFHRAASGKVLHADPSCDRARNHQLLPTEARLIALGTAKVCQFCERAVDEAVLSYVRAGLALVALTGSLERFVASEHVTWPEVLSLQNRARTLESALAAAGRCDLDEPASSVLAEARAAAASRVPADGDLGVRRRVAISSLTRSSVSIPRPTDEYRYPVVLSQTNEAGNAVTSTWREYSNAVHEGVSTGPARVRARARALTVLSATPTRVEHVPHVDLASAPESGSLHEWLTELYVAHRDAALESLLDFWDDLLIEEMNRPEWSSQSLVAYRLTDRLPSGLEHLMIPYERISTPGSSAVAFVVPTPVADAAQAQVWRTLEVQRSTRCLPDHRLAVVEFDPSDRGVVPTALTLWDDDVDFDAAWSAALLVAVNAA